MRERFPIWSLLKLSLFTWTDLSQVWIRPRVLKEPRVLLGNKGILTRCCDFVKIDANSGTVDHS